MPADALRRASDQADADTDSSNVGDPVAACKAPTDLTVVFDPEQEPACPGLPCKLTATASSPNGQFLWTIDPTNSNEIKLVDQPTGGTPLGTKSLASVYLVGFKTDPVEGTIAAQTASVSVTYTDTNQRTANYTRTLHIHEIKFAVTNDAISDGGDLDGYDSDPHGVAIGNGNPTHPTVESNPEVEILLEHCPQPTRCAHNHQVGWLQKVRRSVVRITYEHTEVAWHLPPLPDTRIKNAVRPITFNTAPTEFTNHKNKQTAPMQDSPGIGDDGNPHQNQPPHLVPWTDQRVGSDLEGILYQLELTSWLVVQNTGWSKLIEQEYLQDSFAFLRRFEWDVSIGLQVYVGRRKVAKISEQTHRNIPRKFERGQGGDLSALLPSMPSFNQAMKIRSKPYYTELPR